MKINTIKGTDFDLTESIKRNIYEKFDSLDKMLAQFGSAVSADIEVCKDTKHHKKGPHFHCSVTLSIPGSILHAEERAEDLYEAIDGVRAKLHRQLTDFKRKVTDKVKRSVRPSKV